MHIVGEAPWQAINVTGTLRSWPVAVVLRGTQSLPRETEQGPRGGLGRRFNDIFTSRPGNLSSALRSEIDLAGDLAGQARRQRATIRDDQLRRHQRLVTRFDTDSANALAEQETLDPVNMGGSFT